MLLSYLLLRIRREFDGMSQCLLSVSFVITFIYKQTYGIFQLLLLCTKHTAMTTARDDLLELLSLKKQEFKDKLAQDTHTPSNHNHKRVVKDVPEQHDKSKHCAPCNLQFAKLLKFQLRA